MCGGGGDAAEHIYARHACTDTHTTQTRHAPVGEVAPRADEVPRREDSAEKVEHAMKEVESVAKEERRATEQPKELDRKGYKGEAQSGRERLPRGRKGRR